MLAESQDSTNSYNIQLSTGCCPVDILTIGVHVATHGHSPFTDYSYSRTLQGVHSLTIL